MADHQWVDTDYFFLLCRGQLEPLVWEELLALMDLLVSVEQPDPLDLLDLWALRDHGDTLVPLVQQDPVDLVECRVRKGAQGREALKGSRDPLAQ